MDLTTIQPPPPAPSAQLDLNVQNNAVQQQLQRLPVGVTLVGIVAGNDKNGNLIVRLAGNDLILSSPLALSKNAQLTLKIDNVSGSFVATLLSVDGKTPATQPQTISNQLQQNPNALLKNPADTAKNAFENPNILKVISVLNQGAGKIAPQATSQQTATIVAKSDIVTLTSPQTTGVKAILVTATPEIVQSLKASLALNDSKTASATLTESLPEEVKPGAVLNLKITNAQNPKEQAVQGENKVLPGQEWMKEKGVPNANTKDPVKQMATNLQQLVQNFAASFKPLPNGNIFLNAIVIDTKPNGELLVETRFGKMIIDAGSQYNNVQKGAVLHLELTSFTQMPKDEINLPEEELPLKTLARNWPALKELADHLAPQLGTAMPNKLAGIDNIFAGRMAAFMNAVKSGNIRDWLGANNYDALESDETGSAIIGKLKHDMGILRELNTQTTFDGKWQTMLFPVYDGRELHQARLHVKYLPDENNKPERKVGTRFIVELDTSTFGEIQMDGLVHNNVASKYFDMIIRTHKPLAPEIESNIRQIFTDAGQITGFRGDIEFATMREFPLKIFDQLIEKKLGQQIDHKGIEA